jgi:hypothetical protein
MRRRLRRALVAAGLLATAAALPAVSPADAQQVAPATTLLQSTLAGLREIGPDGALGAGDRDGVGATTVEIDGDQLCFSINAAGVDAPTIAAHIHEAPAGANGPIVVTLVAPGATGRSDGCLDDVDPGLLDRIATDPGAFYVNVHTTPFPNGAVRGQLQPAVTEGELLATRLSGTSEVGPDGEPAVGDPDGTGISTVAVSTSARRACVEIDVQGIVLPAAAAHIHQAAAGVNGPIVVPLTPPGADGISRGCARGLDPALVQAIATDPAGFYVNVHTTDFPNGAVRGQLAPAGAVDGTPPVGPCDDTDERACLLPFPSDSFTVADATTVTGRRVSMPASAFPQNVAGDPVDPSDWNRADGFSPGSPLMTLVPGIDLGNTGVARITDIAASLDEAAPIVLLDAETGERWPYFAELDAHAPVGADPLLIIRPARNFTEGHRYVVALRGVLDASGAAIAPDATFQQLRDGGPLTDAWAVQQSPRFDRLFADLEAAGVERGSLFLAWDFTVASAESTTGRLLHMRDDAYAALGQGVPAFDVQSVEEPADPADPVARRILGTFEVPSYLTGTGATGSRLELGPDGLPVRTGTFTARFLCIVPDSAVEEGGARGVVYGHGLLGRAEEINGFGGFADSDGLVFCATDEIGMSAEDIPTALALSQNISLFPTMPDRLQQGLLNEQFLARLLKDPRGFASDPAFQRDGGSVHATGEVFYNGNSQGGILGGAATAISTEWTRAVLGVPAMNYSTLLDRSVDFDPFAELQLAAYPDEVDRQLGIALIQMLWDRGENNGYAAHMTDDPLPGTPAHEVLLIEAFGDHQVANIATETMARTIGAAVHTPALAPGRSLDVTPVWGVPPVPSDPYDGSVLVIWDFGNPAPPAANVPPREPDFGEDPHGKGGDEPRVLRQASEFLRSDGAFVDTCGGGPCQSDV